MFPNPKPAVDAVGRLGALPGFLFAHPIVAGFFAMLMLPVFGVAASAFFASLGPAGFVDLIEIVRIGARLATAFGVIIFAAIFLSAFFMREERAVRLQFFLGGMLGLCVLVASDLYIVDEIRARLAG
jgi:hypothetical protein